MQSAAACCIPAASDFRPELYSNYKTGRLCERVGRRDNGDYGDASRAARAGAVVARPHSFGSCAYRMARYEVIRRSRTARTLRGALSERDAPLRQAEGTGLFYPVTDRMRSAASQPARAAQGRPRLETRVEESRKRGTLRRTRLAGLVRANERDSGRLAARRRRLTDDDCPPRLGTSVPLPGSARGG